MLHVAVSVRPGYAQVAKTKQKLNIKISETAMHIFDNTAQIYVRWLVYSNAIQV